LIAYVNRPRDETGQEGPRSPRIVEDGKPVAVGLRSLDELPIRQLFPLLDRTPTVVGWDKLDTRAWRWDEGQQIIEVNGPGDLLFVLGTTSQARFTLEAGISQAPWTGNVGLFWGFREDAVRKQAKVPNQEFAWFQMVTLWQGIGAKGEYLHAVQRGKGALVHNRNGQIEVAPHFSFKHDIPLLTGVEKILLISVERDRLNHALLGPLELTTLFGEIPNKIFQSQSCDGGLGVIALSHQATFSSVRFIAH
jgi:hypothetical protein